MPGKDIVYDKFISKYRARYKNVTNADIKKLTNKITHNPLVLNINLKNEYYNMIFKSLFKKYLIKNISIKQTNFIDITDYCKHNIFAIKNYYKKLFNINLLILIISKIEFINNPVYFNLFNNCCCLYRILYIHHFEHSQKK